MGIVRMLAGSFGANGGGRDPRGRPSARASRAGGVSRRSIALLVLVLFAAACAGAQDDSGGDGGGGGGGDQGGGGGGGDGEPCLRAAFVFVGPTSVAGWSGAAGDALGDLEQQIPCMETRSLVNVTEGTEAERVFSDLAEEGFDVIYGHTFGYMDTMVAVSERYPDVIFEHSAGYKTTDNMSNYFGAGWEGTYLLGIAAAEVTEAKKLGWVASFPVPDVLWDLNAFAIGARSVDPSITVQVAFTSNWYDPVKDKQAAESLLDAGADVLGQSSGSPSVGEVAEQAGVWWVPTLDRKQKSWGPTTMLGVRHYNWGVAFETTAQEVIDGTWTNEPYFGNLADGFVEVGDFNPDIPADALSQVEETKQQIIDGSLQIWAGPIEDNQGNVVIEEGTVANAGDLAAGSFLVEGVIGSIPA
jgi:basic membrane protein A and related proteins